MTSTRRTVAARIAACLLLTAGSATDVFAEAATPTTRQTGSFELTFAERAPLSDPKTLATRLRLATPPADYDLAQIPFLVYVPESYDAKRPMGLVVWMNYKASATLPTTVLSQFADANCGFVVAKPRPDALATRVGSALDAVHGLAARYAIDPRRVYVFGGGEGMDEEGKSIDSSLSAGLSFADVFTGTFALGFGYYHVIRDADGSTWKPTIPVPDIASLALARLHPLVLAEEREQPYYGRCVTAFKADGFRHVDVMSLSLDAQLHYPNLSTDWIPAVLKFMDDATQHAPATTRATPTTRATTRPVVAHPPAAHPPAAPRPAPRPTPRPAPAPRPAPHAGH